MAKSNTFKFPKYLEACFARISYRCFLHAKKQQWQKDLQNERLFFSKIVQDLKNVPGCVYQGIKLKDDTDLELNSAMLVIARGFKPFATPKKRSQKEERAQTTENEERFKTPDQNQQNTQEKKKTTTTAAQQGTQSIPKVIDLYAVPVTLPVNGFTTVARLPLIVQTTAVIVDDRTHLVGLSAGTILVPKSSKLDCVSLQPTMGNLALGIQKILGLHVIPDQDIHIMVDPQVAVQYFNKICDELDWNFDISQFDLNKPFILQMGDTKITIDLNMQRKQPLTLQQRTKETALLPAVQMKYEGALIVPPQPLQMPELNLDRLSVQNMPESLVATLMLASFAQVQEIKKLYPLFNTLQWFSNIQLLVKAQQALFEFVSLVGPKPYERVISKLDEIISEQDLVTNFFGYSDDENRKGITDQDIDNYFEYAPMENIISILDRFDNFSSENISEILTKIPSNSLNSLFQRTSIENILKLFNGMDGKQKLAILKRVSPKSLHDFVDDLTMQNFSDLFKNMHKEQLQLLKLSDTKNVYDYLIDKTVKESNLRSKNNNYVTMQELQRMNLQEIEQLAQERQKGYEQWKGPDIQPHQTRSQQTYVSHSHIPIIPPINYRRYLEPRSIKHYISERGGDIVRGIVHSGTHGLS